MYGAKLSFKVWLECYRSIEFLTSGAVRAWLVHDALQSIIQQPQSDTDPSQRMNWHDILSLVSLNSLICSF